MKKKSTKHTNHSLSKHIVELSNFTLDLQKKIEKANLLDGNTDHKFAFMTGNFNLVLPDHQPAEIIVPPRICTVPRTPDWFRGMINLRGNLLPVFDLDILISGNYSESYNWLLVFGTDESMASICIDTLPTTIELNNKLEKSHCDIPEILYAHVDNVYLENDVIWIEPDYTSLLSDLPRHFWSVET